MATGSFLRPTQLFTTATLITSGVVVRLVLILIYGGEMYLWP